MKFGYNTNGLGCHRPRQAIELLAECGYRSVAITLDHGCLDPYSDRLNKEIDEMRALLDRYGMISVIETGARYLLNPRVKHEPTLLSSQADERAARIDFLKRCIDVAVRIGSQAVSYWSGVLREPIESDAALDRLTEGVVEVAEYGASKGIPSAFEPEPGMFIETMEQYRRLRQRIDSPGFGLTLDVGHLHCVEAESIAEHVHRWSDLLFNVHIEDMQRGVHEHLRFGEGTIDFPPVLAALTDVGYQGGVNVELSRHSHMAPEVVRESMEFLTRMLP